MVKNDCHIGIENHSGIVCNEFTVFSTIIALRKRLTELFLQQVQQAK